VRYAKTFESWHENIRDWCISRQLWWGHRIPVWAREGAAVGADARAALERAGDARGGAGAERGASRSSMIAVESDFSKRGCVHRVRRRDDGEPEELLCVPEAQQPLIPEIERAGFRQDEDVLDTWFSSALWPLSTLGWPDPARFDMEGLLETFNPSTVLCTAREIITLWVSRMVMFNRYFTGDHHLPFRHVYIHPVVQDGFGQKMSKSLANGVDPRDIIRTHGADAMRFVLAQIATDTQDVRLQVDVLDPHSGQTFTPVFVDDGAGHRVAAPTQESPAQAGKRMVTFYGVASGKATPTKEMPLALNTSSRFDVGRNYATKLWNAVRFALGSVEGGAAATDSGAPRAGASGASGAAAIDPATRPLIDRWILARLARAVQSIDAALDRYRFSDAVDALYDFFWRDVCDWYLEGIKPTVRSDAAQQAILLRVIDATLRLTHPLCPFVTEALWSEAGPASAARPAITGLELPPSDLLATARWPRFAAATSGGNAFDDASVLEEFGRVQALVNAIRNVRGERKVAPKRRIGIIAPEPIQALIVRAGGVVEALAGTDTPEGGNQTRASESNGAARPRGAAPLPFEGEEILLTGLADEADQDGERQRLTRIIAERRQAVDGFERKLNNPGYLAKAPPDVVAQTRQMLETARGDLAAAERSLAAIGS